MIHLILNHSSPELSESIGISFALFYQTATFAGKRPLLDAEKHENDAIISAQDVLARRLLRVSKLHRCII